MFGSATNCAREYQYKQSCGAGESNESAMVHILIELSTSLDARPSFEMQLKCMNSFRNRRVVEAERRGAGRL